MSERKNNLRQLTEYEKWKYAQRMGRKTLVGLFEYLVTYIIALDSPSELQRTDDERISELEEQTGFNFDKTARHFAIKTLGELRQQRENSLIRNDDNG